MTMQKRPQTLIHNSLSSSELIILRSIALGLGCDTIRDLLELSEDGIEFVTTLQINDLFLLDLEESEINLEHESNSFIAKHLYRVQKLSSKFYEFRLVHHNDTSLTESPYYIRINNFGHRKTGWQTHNPIKVWMNSIGKLYIKDEAKEFKKSLKTYS